MQNVKNLTTQFKAIPPERRKEKFQRTLVGLGLMAAGFAGFYLTSHGWVSKDFAIQVERGSGLALALGGWTASYEFLLLPIRAAIALAKDILALVKGTPRETPPSA